MTFASFATASGTIELAVGAQRQISASRTLQRVAVGDPAIADVLIMKGSRSGSVLLTAKAPGATNVMLWERGHDEPTVWNVEVVDAAAQAVLDGSTPRVNAYGGTAVLQGSSASLEAHARAAAVGKNTSGKGAVIDRSTVPGKSVVQVDVRVVEFSRSVLKQVGFNFFKQSNGFSFGSFSPGGVQSYSGGSGPGTAGYVPTLGSPVASAFNLVVNAAGRGILPICHCSRRTISLACWRSRRSSRCPDRARAFSRAARFRCRHRKGSARQRSSGSNTVSGSR
ncbi:pilus formation N terminal region family protein [Burkholderia cepacia]|nr:pilus formation N terminal region family protein [Burkholderia cepacia]